MSEKHDELEKIWVEDLKNPRNTIHFLKDQPKKYLCSVCNDDQERLGDCKSILEQHTITKTHQRNLKEYKRDGKKNHIVVSSEEEEEEEEEQNTKKKGRADSRRRRGDDEKEDDSDSDRPSRKRERSKDIDLAYTSTAAARVPNAVATLPKPQRQTPPPPPAALPVPSMHKIFQQAYSDTLKKALSSEEATKTCHAQFASFLQSQEAHDAIVAFWKTRVPTVFDEHLAAFMTTPKAQAMIEERYARYLDSPDFVVQLATLSQRLMEQ